MASLGDAYIHLNVTPEMKQWVRDLEKLAERFEDLNFRVPVVRGLRDRRPDPVEDSVCYTIVHDRLSDEQNDVVPHYNRASLQSWIHSLWRNHPSKDHEVEKVMNWYDSALPGDFFCQEYLVHIKGGKSDETREAAEGGGM